MQETEIDLTSRDNKDKMRPMNTTIQEVSQMTAMSRRHLSGILNGKRKASPKKAIVLANLIGGDPALWIFGSAEERKAAWHRMG